MSKINNAADLKELAERAHQFAVPVASNAVRHAAEAWSRAEQRVSELEAQLAAKEAEVVRLQRVEDYTKATVEACIDDKLTPLAAIMALTNLAETTEDDLVWAKSQIDAARKEDKPFRK